MAMILSVRAEPALPGGIDRRPKRQAMQSISGPEGLQIETLSGAAISEFIEEVAQLRLSVFREFPYLYEGDLEYESKYLRSLADSTGSILVVAKSGSEIVGVSTALPLTDADAPFRAPFARPEPYYYFGESVLLKDYRGQGIGHRFFDRREQAGRERGFPRACFCAVVRDDEHPKRPPHYRSLEPFWESRGYRRSTGLTALYSWKEIGQEQESEKLMEFWEREL